MPRLRLAAAALLVGLLAAGLASAAAGPPKLIGTAGPGYTTLVGTVGPGFTISLTMNGAKVTKLKAGNYLFVVTDKATIHSFVLEQESGGKLEKELTTVGFQGTNVYTVTLAKGKYKFYCKPHESSMFGNFTVS
jgi:plastocyanin